MYFSCLAIYADVIIYSFDSWEAICYVVHVYLEDVLGHLESKWHVKEAVTSLVCTKCGDIGRRGFQVNAQNTTLALSLEKTVALLSLGDMSSRVGAL